MECTRSKSLFVIFDFSQSEETVTSDDDPHAEKKIGSRTRASRGADVVVGWGVVVVVIVVVALAAVLVLLSEVVVGWGVVVVVIVVVALAAVLVLLSEVVVVEVVVQ
ncbi:hypothetical protein ElyMa_000677800 [Elysia marginata]|uniref:ABC transmembrane type-1 domain-containing protein n=1 Tax=Elysia marginata TaxID=1093978 RepID=A0AAV4GH91_9GAST|nr:hypothetical protein ElyMa_000677800 [Elysia marginata]